MSNSGSSRGGAGVSAGGSGAPRRSRSSRPRSSRKRLLCGASASTAGRSGGRHAGQSGRVLQRGRPEGAEIPPEEVADAVGSGSERPLEPVPCRHPLRPQPERPVVARRDADERAVERHAPPALVVVAEVISQLARGPRDGREGLGAAGQPRRIGQAAPVAVPVPARRRVETRLEPDVVAGGNEVERRSHEGRLHDGASMEGVRQRGALESLDSRPEPDVRGPRLLRLQAGDALERVGHAQRLARERPACRASSAVEELPAA